MIENETFRTLYPHKESLFQAQNSDPNTWDTLVSEFRSCQILDGLCIVAITQQSLESRP